MLGTEGDLEENTENKERGRNEWRKDWVEGGRGMKRWEVKIGWDSRGVERCREGGRQEVLMGGWMSD